MNTTPIFRPDTDSLVVTQITHAQIRTIPHPISSFLTLKKNKSLVRNPLSPAPLPPLPPQRHSYLKSWIASISSESLTYFPFLILFSAMVTSTQPLSETQLTSAEEEALKRNTDCVYFLASPLTCKKGSECEYRHSDYARVNPRDCYYWLNGNCLNPKCGFRHPPLDGLYGNQVAESAASTLPPPQTAALPSVQTPYNSGKQSVPCIFFQKGFCMKGDKCAFLHGPIPATNKVSMPVALSNNMEPTLVKKYFGGLQKCNQEQKASSAIISKTAERHAKALKKAEVLSTNRVGVERDVQQAKSIDDVPRHTKTIPTILNGNYGLSNPLHQPQLGDDNGFQNDKDADDHLRDSSPGFDVLVDDEEREAEYYHGEVHYERAIGSEGRNSRSADNYEMGHSADYNLMTDTDQEMYRDPRGCDSYERMQGYAWEQHSDRMRKGAGHLDGGGYSISESPERIEDSELRYRLSKQRRGNGLRSVVSHDFCQDNLVEDRGQLRSDRLPSHGSSISSRLRGRIELPGRSPNHGGDLRAEREMNRGRIWGRLSPGRAHPGRLRDRIKGRLGEDYNPEGRNLKVHRIRRELTDDRNTDFAGPKSLAELKDGKHVEVGSHHIMGKRKQSESQQAEDLSFEAPLSLGEILKRKREADRATFGSGSQPTNTEDDNQKASFSSSSNAQAPGALSSHLKDENNNLALDGKKESSSAMLETDEVENGDVADDESLQPTLNEYGNEDGMMGDDGIEYNVYVGDEQRDGDYEYEQDYEGEYNYEEGENAEAEEEYVDDQEDDYAKRSGAVLS